MITGIKTISVPVIARKDPSKVAFRKTYAIIKAATEKAIPTA